MTPTIARILVPVDFSLHSDLALRYATTLASRFGASIELFHVLEDPLGPDAWNSELYVPNLPELRENVIADAKRRLAACCAIATERGVSTMTTFGTGQTARTISDYAKIARSDVIVMGTHGRTGLGHAWMGSVAERVVRDAPCPVLTVREHAAGEEHRAATAA
jgi:universal stress protein A